MAYIIKNSGGITSVLGDLQSWVSSSYSGDVLYSQISDEELSFGQLCYRTASGKWGLADATSIGVKSKSILGICVTGNNGQGEATSILINGFVQTTYATSTIIGEPVFMKASTPAGYMTSSAPSDPGNIVRIVGHTFWTTTGQSNGVYILRFNPDNTWIELS